MRSEIDDAARSLLDAMPLGTALVDGRGAIVYANDPLCRAVSRSGDDLRSGTILSLAADADGPGGRVDLGRLLLGGGQGAWEGRMLDGDQQELWVRIDVGPAPDGWGDLRLLQVRELSERWEAQVLEARRVAGRVMAQSATAEGALAAVLPPLAEALDFEVAAAWALDAETGELCRQSLWESAASSQKAGRGVARRGAGFVRTAWEDGHPVAGVRDDPGPQAAQTRSGIAFPLRVAAEPLAVIELSTSRGRRFEPDFLASLGTLGAEMGEHLARKRVGGLDQDANQLLLVEDNALMAALVREMLRDLDGPLELIHVDRLSSARERLVSWRPACILLDLTLPDADGLRALIEIRKLAPEVPIVVLTGQEDESLAVRAVQEGAQDYLSKRRVDLHGLGRAIRYAIERKGAEQQQLEQRLRDRLTGLPSRVLFLDRLRVALRRNGPGAVAVVLVNLDRFRLVNDSLGHEAGDELLLQTAERLVGAAGDGATVSSFGGDEFGILLESDEAELEAIDLARALVDLVAQRLSVAAHDVTASATIGIAINHAAEMDPLTLIAQADTALSRGKELGGGRFEVFDSAVRERLLEQLKLESGIRTAIEEEQLRVFYQPLVLLAERSVFGVEALVRWEHPERGLLTPDEFMAAAEQTGLVVGLGRAVMRQACRQLVQWRTSIPAVASLRMNVNLSGRQLADPDLLADMTSIVAGEGLEPPDICLEVTETALLEDTDASRGAVADLKRAGFHIALDDFGTGYSSLSYLQRFPVDLLKLDRSFVAALRERGEAAIVSAVAGMAEGLGVPVLAEGIEEEEDIARLQALGYGLGQGYWFGQPEPPGEIEAMLRGTVALRAKS
jgi:diguanylate cyclase (GGDEF)-like protein